MTTHTMPKRPQSKRQPPLTEAPGADSTTRNGRSTLSGAAHPDQPVSRDVLLAKVAASQDLAKSFPFNPNKPSEYDTAALSPEPGAFSEPRDPLATASTVSESNASDKVGSGGPAIGRNPTTGPLDRVRVDSTGRVLTTNQGVQVADNQNSLKVGLRGPALLEDFILREKISLGTTSRSSSFKTQ